MSSLALRLCVRCAWLLLWRAGTPATARAAADRQLQRGHAKGLVSVDLRRVHTTWVGAWYRKPLCKASVSTEMVQRSIHFGTVNIGGTIIIDATGGVGTYTVAADCTGTLSITNGPSFNIYVGPGAQQVWTTQIVGR